MSETTSNSAQSAARNRRVRSRYDRPRYYVSWWGLALGMIVGMAGGVFFAWNIVPVQQVNTAPWQLSEPDRDAYIVAIMLNYEYDGDLQRAVAELSALRLPGNDPIQQVADVACRLASTGYVDSNGGLRAVRSMMTFYQNQGRSGCADTLIPDDAGRATEVLQLELPTPTPIPVATKTPTPFVTTEPTETPIPFIPTEPPPRAFELVDRRSFCSVEFPGVIEVRVVDFNTIGIPGQPVRVRWSDGESTFFTGLKPERGPGYADFEMEAGLAYQIEMPGLSDPSTTPLIASECTLEGGLTSITSYRVVFQGG